MDYKVREAKVEDVPYVASIYNQGIEDRVATLETRLRDNTEMLEWLSSRGERYKVIVIEDRENIVRGWASINLFNSRCCYSGVGDLSIYIDRSIRGKGLGKILLSSVLKTAKKQEFHKLVLSTFESNEAGKSLYRALGFREVGTYENQGILDGKFINVTIMEKLI
ncbi:GNAT family N-acetyltransferase [Clostridium bovifaecis]|uniref:GNAT family N-acetyltransferase n=1 Tax=Clostridium bovifaecis TaxID=2184719 RepID=A0A6I6F7Q1_9CLOT|nr:GNAT family N-acetyltransferase [Clostridium bovifaecis]